jgi:membrane associated rhomboid family serine protease
MQTVYGALVRHILSFIGGWLVLKGLVPKNELPVAIDNMAEFIGSAIGVGAFVWSIYRKWKDGVIKDELDRTAGGTGGSKG